MRQKTFLFIALFALNSSVISCTAQTTNASLKDLYKKDFFIGTALNAPQIKQQDPAAANIITTQFNAVTAENIMKCEVIHPGWNNYDFKLADQFVAYGQKNKQFIVGHTLIWHSQLAHFVKTIKDKDSLLQFMTTHINTIVTRYAGKVNGWDVVNEALEEDGSLRQSIFYNLLGEDYIVKAFHLAQAADPKAELYYNDYNIELPKKRAGAIALIKKLQAAGVRIDGVGIQGHWRYNKVPLKDIEDAIKEYAALGIKVMFTEVDLGVIPNPWDSDAADVNMKAEYSAKMNPYTAGVPDSVLAEQAVSYQNLFGLFLKYKNNISRITFWGLNDGQSWLNDWPIKGRTNYPLLFDRQFKPKPAFYKVAELKTKN
ncbi:MAG: endo-1,4-beta-xylanase [Lacibacter sp.]